MAHQDSELVVSYLTLRQMIGWIGLLMPISVRLGALSPEHREPRPAEREP